MAFVIPWQAFGISQLPFGLSQVALGTLFDRTLFAISVTGVSIATKFKPCIWDNFSLQQIRTYAERNFNPHSN